ncbi:MAG: hypothetical protein K8I82_06180 [Anaerolineae bacterium]|nr:hypothetical protein [Anaerolineae bacterium]
MTVNINDIRHRRNEALKTMSVMLVRKLLLDDLERLIQEVERLRDNRQNPSEENGWQIETYTARRKLKNGTVVEYEYQREWKWEDGVKVVRHVKNTGRNAGRNGR